VLEGVLDLINVAEAFPDACSPGQQTEVKRWRELVGAMLEWLDAMTHPDGEIVLFNDAALGVAPPRAELAEFANRLGVAHNRSQSLPVLHLRDTGYLRVQVGPATAFLDAGPLGPDYLPAHGHADTLTFELSLHGRRVLVDTGVSTYQDGAERLQQRGTAAHNTLLVDGEDSSEVWGAFRVARRARVFDVEVESLPDGVAVAAAHDGYLRLKGRTVHRRKWKLETDALTIEDTVAGHGEHDVHLAIHVHPDFSVFVDEAGLVIIQDGDGSAIARMSFDSWLVTEVASYDYHPEFGISLSAQKTVSRWSGSLPARLSTKIAWTLNPGSVRL
ncbi:MAG TPA: heparinase II/III-family protein, partial [Gammaproteobacteria bacterium]|nr:heparinase II/III-family protein [Gammaproteobacteria bacterium]